MLSSVCDKSSRSKQLQQIGMSLMEEMKGEKLQGTAGMSKDINKELWHACAGPLVSLPYIGSLVYYFPQGHTEQVAKSTRQIANTQIPNYPSLPSQLLCQVDNLTLHADKDTDEIFAQLTLRPIKNDMDLLYPPDFGQRQIKHPSEYFCKTLTASDTSTHGGFSVPRRAAEKLFPPLDFSMQPPTQELVVRDLHGNTWTFRHIYRGQPKRHLLTTGWSLFIGSKRLKAGDSVLFIRDSKSQLLLGVRRANRQQTTLPSSVLSADSMHMGVLAAAAHAAANHCPFTVFYNPRACPSEFVVSVAKIEKALFGIQVSVGMRFGMMFETEESGKRRYMGSIVGVSDIDPVRWPNSKWRTLQVEWDEPCSTGRHSRINIWDIDTAESPVLSSNLFRTLNQYQLAFPGVQDSRNCSTQNRVPFMQGSMEAESNLATVCKVKQQHEQGIPGRVFDGLIVPSQSPQICVRNVKRVPQDMSEVPSVTSKKLHQYVCKQQQSLLLQNLRFPNTVGERHVPGSSSLPLTQIETSERAMECSAVQAKNSVETLEKTKNPVDSKGNEKKANDSFIDLTAITGKKPISRTVTEPSEDETRKRSSSPTVSQESQQFNANLQVTSQMEKPLGNANDSLQLINELLLQHGSPSQFQMLPQAQNKEKHLDLQSFAYHAFDANKLNSGMQLELQQGSQISPHEDWMPHSGFLQSLNQVLSSSEPAPSYMTEFDRSVSLNPHDGKHFGTHDGKHVAQYVMETNPLSQDPNLLNFCSTTGVLYPKMTDMGGQQGDINMACLSKVVASSMDCNNQLSPFAGLAFEGNDTRSLMDHSASSSIIEGYKVIGDNCFHNISEGFFGDYSSSQDLQSQVTGPADSQAFSVHEIPDCSEIMAPCGVVNDTSFMNNSAYQQASLPVRTYTKVQKAGSVGRSIDVTRFKDYDELQRAIAHMFGLEWEQYDSRGSGWKLVYTDYENDVLLVGDDPWEEFINCVRCIRILSQSEIQQMSQEGIQVLHSASKLMSADT